MLSRGISAALVVVSLLFGAGLAVQFRYAMVSQGGAGVVLWDRWNSRVCIAVYGLERLQCTPRDAEAQRLHQAGFSQKEISNWLNSQKK